MEIKSELLQQAVYVAHQAQTKRKLDAKIQRWLKGVADSTLDWEIKRAANEIEKKALLTLLVAKRERSSLDWCANQVVAISSLHGDMALASADRVI